MATINQLNQASQVNAYDLLAIYSTDNGGAQNLPISMLSDYILAIIGGASGIVTQYAAPSATGFSVQLGNVPNTWLLLTPVADYAAGTLVLPTVLTNQMEITVNSTHAITALSITGGTVIGAPTTLTANGFFKLRYDNVSLTWYRIN
jgi:hypothetical protein